MTAIKERPILFNGEMVRAILGGRKTVTRRAVKPSLVALFDPPRGQADIEAGYPFVECEDGYVSAVKICPYGQPGDRLWVRETFALLGNEDGVCVDWHDNMQKGDDKSAAKIYRASCVQGDYGLWEIPDKANWKPDTEDLLYEGAWTPSIHMPRGCCRILLEVTAVRIERLQDISRSDIRAEGLQCPPELGSDDVSPNYRDWYPAAWRDLWNSTGGDWAANPWVWVVEFKRAIPTSS